MSCSFENAMHCESEDSGFFPAELKVDTKKLVCRIIEEAGAELISSVKASPTISQVVGDIGSTLAEDLQSAVRKEGARRGADMGVTDPDTTVYMEDPDEEGTCVGVRLWDFSDLLVRQATQLILDSRKCNSGPSIDLTAAKDYHTELLCKFVEQAVKNLLENVTHLTKTPPKKEVGLGKEPSNRVRPSKTTDGVHHSLPTLEDESGGGPSNKSVPKAPLTNNHTGVEAVPPRSEKKSFKSIFRPTKMFKNSVAPLIEESQDASASHSAIKKPKKTFSSPLTRVLSRLICFGCTTAIHP